jgi:hypothetical protein
MLSLMLALVVSSPLTDDQKLVLAESLLAPVYFIQETALHETSHTVAALSYGYKITEFKPYPHVEYGGFVFGDMMYRGHDRFAIDAAPFMLDRDDFVTVQTTHEWAIKVASVNQECPELMGQMDSWYKRYATD